jgi:hypothetical protein
LLVLVLQYHNDRGSGPNSHKSRHCGRNGCTTYSEEVLVVPSLLASLPYPGPVMEEKVTMTLVVEDDSHPQCCL